MLDICCHYLSCVGVMSAIIQIPVVTSDDTEELSNIEINQIIADEYINVQHMYFIKYNKGKKGRQGFKWVNEDIISHQKELLAKYIEAEPNLDDFFVQHEPARRNQLPEAKHIVVVEGDSVFAFENDDYFVDNMDPKKASQNNATKDLKNRKIIEIIEPTLKNGRREWVVRYDNEKTLIDHLDLRKKEPEMLATYMRKLLQNETKE